MISPATLPHNMMTTDTKVLTTKTSLMMNMDPTEDKVTNQTMDKVTIKDTEIKDTVIKDTEIKDTDKNKVRDMVSMENPKPMAQVMGKNLLMEVTTKILTVVMILTITECLMEENMKKDMTMVMKIMLHTKMTTKETIDRGYDDIIL